MVSPQVAVYKYSTIQSAVDRGAHICVQEGAILHTILEETYPEINTVGKDSEQSLFESLRIPVAAGGCDAVVHQFNSFEIYQHTKIVNSDCAINSEKRIDLVLPAGMATLVDNGPISDDTDSQNKCTSLISHVLDYHLTAMADDGFLESAWNDHLQRIGTIECIHESFSGGGVEDTVSLRVQDVGGIFILHATLSFAALALGVFQFCVKYRKEQLQDERTLESVFGIQHAREILQKKRLSSSQILTDDTSEQMHSARETTFDQADSTMEMMSEIQPRAPTTGLRNLKVQFRHEDTC